MVPVVPPGTASTPHGRPGPPSLGNVDNRTEVREFLVSRRARLTPEQAGLLACGGRRRVPGLRREEVALLAGVSLAYYTRLERGRLGGVSLDVLEALSRALKLDEADRTHLFDLARAVNARPGRRRRSAARQVRPTVQQIIDAMSSAPAVVRNSHLDYLAANRLGRALYAPLFDSLAQPANSARFVFLDPRAPHFYKDWNGVANDIVAILRAEAGRNPYDKGLTELIGELSTRSGVFGARWAAHNVLPHHTGTVGLRHPVVGELVLAYESMELPADSGLTIHACTAAPGSTSADALELLASWAASQEPRRAEISARPAGQ
jgi:transcriptional regulator with XRE-family HTH domain